MALPYVTEEKARMIAERVKDSGVNLPTPSDEDIGKALVVGESKDLEYAEVGGGSLYEHSFTFSLQNSTSELSAETNFNVEYLTSTAHFDTIAAIVDELMPAGRHGAVSLHCVPSIATIKNKICLLVSVNFGNYTGTNKCSFWGIDISTGESVGVTNLELESIHWTGDYARKLM